MKIKSPIGFLGLWSAFLAAGTWITPVATLFCSPRQACAVVAEQSGAEAGELAVTGEYVLNKREAVAQEDMLRAHGEAFSSLFGRQWDPENWTYPLSERVTGEGRYRGKNHLDEPYTLTVVRWIPVDLSGMSLSIEQRELIECSRLSVAGVFGILTTKRARVHMFGVVASKRDASSEPAWAFLPAYYADPGHPVFADQGVSPDQGSVAAEDGFTTDAPPPPMPSGVSSDCIDEAVRRYGDAVDSCNTIHNIAVRGCNEAYNLAIDRCNEDYARDFFGAHGAWNDCMKYALIAATLGLLLCLTTTAGWGSVACYTISILIAVALERECSEELADELDRLDEVREDCEESADDLRRNCLSTAAAIRAACIAAALDDLAARIVDCGTPQTPPGG